MRNRFKLLPVCFKGIDGFHKRAVFACHDHVDGVEVFSAKKASGQVGFRICGGLEFTANGTKKSELTFTHLARNFKKVLNQNRDWDVISQREQFISGKSFHGVSFQKHGFPG